MRIRFEKMKVRQDVLDRGGRCRKWGCLVIGNVPWECVSENVSYANCHSRKIEFGLHRKETWISVCTLVTSPKSTFN